jgi:prevent-host-death family protein
MRANSIGTFEAKAHLSELLDRVVDGESITITRHGTPVAKLVPIHGADRQSARAAASQWKALRAGNRLGPGLSIKQLREEGRR